MDLTITDAADAERYEAHLDGELAGIIEYVLKHGRIALVHTEVMSDYEGRGVAGSLTRFALDDARRRGLRVVPVCPYVKAYLKRHPEDGDLVAGAAPG